MIMKKINDMSFFDLLCAMAATILILHGLISIMLM